jgi:hypothetical protein
VNAQHIARGIIVPGPTFPEVRPRGTIAAPGSR